MEQVSAFRVIFSLAFVLLAIGLLEYYAFKGVYITFGNGRSSMRNVKWIYWSITAMQWGMLFLMMFRFGTLRESNPQLLMGLFAAFIVIAAPKLVMSVFHLIDDVRLLITKGYFKIRPSGNGGEVISRATFITRTGQYLGLAAFGGFLYGVTKGRFNYRVIAHELRSAVLPKSFDGLRIVQISDAHLGSFAEQFDDVKKGIDMINSLDADYVFFTGDMVNNLSEEAEPWIPYFKEIKAKYGKYSIFGNHDYGDYGPLSEDAKKATQERLVAIQEEMGFEMLMNRSVQLERNGEVIDLIGVENWGNHFRKSGDLKKALEGTDEKRFQILLSHDPT
ncbi:MAG: metallophosphoesterase, partial [Flavobacteriales bacterium]|nr:metallophosphoesterase [Flavobacteriales bacterium]